MNEMLIGAIAMACFVIGLFFLRFWKTTKDRFFLFFAISFWIEAMNRASLIILPGMSEDFPSYYLIRLLAYSFIVAAILDKNRRAKRVE